MKLYAYQDGRRLELEVAREQDHIVISGGGKTWTLSMDDLRTPIRACSIGDRRIEFGWVRSGEQYQIVIGGVTFAVAVKDQRSERLESVLRAAHAHDSTIEVRAPIPGLISKVFVIDGAKVSKDQPVMTLDAMKMENEITSPREGVIKQILVQPAQTVEKGQLLAVIG